MGWTKTVPLPSNWHSIKTGIFVRDRNHCLIVGPTCIGRATQVDHILNRARGGTNHPSNLQAACEPCHTAKTKAEAAVGRAMAPKAKRTPERHPGLA